MATITTSPANVSPEAETVPTPPAPASRPTPPAPPAASRRRSQRPTRLPLILGVPKWVALTIGAVIMLVPFYILVISAFKPVDQIFANPLGITADSFTVKYLVAALTTSKFNVVAAYGTTLLFVVLVDVLCIVLSAPAAYIIARGKTRWHTALLLLFVSGLFVPPQVTLIPVLYVLRTLHLVGTIPGFVLYETSMTLPITIFLFVAYIRTIPTEIDEAASIDGAGRIRAFWSCIFPIMTPAVATVIVLHSIGVWNDFVSPQVILGPSSGLYTVTTGVYAAISQYSTDFTVVFPTLLLAVAPAVIFFIFMQRYIIGGLVAGATKG